MKVLIKTRFEDDDYGYSYALINLTKDLARRYIVLMNRVKELRQKLGEEYSDLKSSSLKELVFGSQRTPQFAYDLGPNTFNKYSGYEVRDNSPLDTDDALYGAWGEEFIKVSPAFKFSTHHKKSPQALTLHVTENEVYWEVEAIGVGMELAIVRTFAIPRWALDIMAVRE